MNHDPKDIITKADDLNLDYFTDSEIDSRYSEWLDEIHDPCIIAGITFQPSCILCELDPTAYRCGFSDYLDFENLDEVGNYYMLRSDIETCTDDLDRDAEALDDEEDTDE